MLIYRVGCEARQVFAMIFVHRHREWMRIKGNRIMLQHFYLLLCSCRSSPLSVSCGCSLRSWTQGFPQSSRGLSPGISIPAGRRRTSEFVPKSSSRSDALRWKVQSFGRFDELSRYLSPCDRVAATACATGTIERSRQIRFGRRR